MIKPFEIIETVTEPSGDIGVHFKVVKGVVINDHKTQIMTLTAYLAVPAGDNIDDALFSFLDAGGWV